MNEDFFDRLDKYMSHSGLNDNKLTVLASLSIGALGKQRKGSRGLGSDSIAKILYSCPDLNGDWLLTGRGDMLRDERPAQAPAAAPPPPQVVDHGREALYKDMLGDKDNEIGRLNRELGACQQRIRDIENKNGGNPEVLGSARSAVSPIQPDTSPVR